MRSFESKMAGLLLTSKSKMTPIGSVTVAKRPLAGYEASACKIYIAPPPFCHQR